MKKKVMTMVLAASMLLGMAGCGSSSANDSAAAKWKHSRRGSGCGRNREK